jgi:protein-disulfide isomerase
LFHPYACGYALLAWCAGEQGRFWEANDYLFSEGLRRERVTARELGDVLQLDAAALSDCSRSDPARRAVQEDMAAARSHGVQGTPTFVVEGEVHLGMIPEELLSELLGGAPDASQRDR